MDEKEKLQALHYRPRGRTWNEYIDLITMCVSRLRMGEKPYQLYGVGKNVKNPVVSQDLGIKIGRDYAAGRLDFIEPFWVDESEQAKRDPFRITRYDIVKEAEEMAPNSLWNLTHMKAPLDSGGLGLDHDTAVERLEEYLSLRDLRIEAEVSISQYELEMESGHATTSKGVQSKMVMFEMTPPIMAMRNFRGLPRYLWLLYYMNLSTYYPQIPPKWVNTAINLRLKGKLTEKDDNFVVAADTIFNYAVWESPENFTSWHKSFRRLFRTDGAYQRFTDHLLS